MTRRKPKLLDLAEVAQGGGPDRWRIVLRALHENLWERRPRRTEAEILATAYDGDARLHWASALCEVISVFDFADLLAVHLLHDEVAANRGRLRLRCAGPKSRMIATEGHIQQHHRPVFEAMYAAATGSERFFIGDTALLLGRRLDWLSMKRVKLRPRDAAAWLPANPNARHLIPMSLSAYLGPKAGASSSSRRTAAKPAVVAEARLRQLLMRPEIAELSRNEQRAAARQRFAPSRVSDRQFRVLAREHPRQPGRKPKS